MNQDVEWNCGTCKFCVETILWDGGVQARCHRYPPTIYAKASPGSMHTNEGVDENFPRVSHWLFCGEWVAKKG